MRGCLKVLAVCLMSSVFAWCATPDASLILVKHKDARVQSHKAHKAPKHKAPKHDHHHQSV